MSDGPMYELSPIASQRTPRLPGLVVQRPTGDALIDALLADLFIHAGNCVREFGDFHLVIDADPAIEPVLRRLLYDPAYREMPWTRTRVWLASEQRVPPDDPARAWPIVRDMIGAHSGIPDDQIHAIDPDAPEAYDALLREHLGWRPKGHDRPDCALLVLRADAGVGAVRGANSIARGDFCVEHGSTPTSPATVGVNDAILNASRLVAVYVSGEDARRGLSLLERARGTSAALGAMALRPPAGELRWYVDPACCTRVPAEHS
ncbi:MAG: 6-phosphogluconolactonase [Planctomycetota bacterium]|nr:6-phosphogluconolactonase [Planctomycetota bacterium]